MEFKIYDYKIEYVNDTEVLAYVTFPLESEGVVNITRTVVSDTLRGQGIAGKLMNLAYETISQRGLKAKLTCSYAIGWFEKNQDKRDILA